MTSTLKRQKKNYSLNIKGTLLDMSSPLVMGIVNLTPDSFYDGGKLKNDQQIISRAEEILSSGASIIDVGGYSSRPDADHISSEEEINRTSNSIASIMKAFPEAIVSIDTFRSEVAQAAIDSGACIINDISAGEQDEKILAVAGHHKTPYIAMHMRGTPQTMQTMTDYDHLVHDVIDYFQQKIKTCREKGIYDVIIDPGFGFSKTLEQNYELLGGLSLLEVLEVPILVGASRKSMIYKLLDISPSEALNGSTVVNTISILNGANILRVHDVKEAMEAVKIIELID